MKPAFQELAQKAAATDSGEQAIAFAVVLMENGSDRTLPRRLGITALPTVLFYADGVPLDGIKIEGCKTRELKQHVSDLQKKFCVRAEKEKESYDGSKEVCKLSDDSGSEEPSNEGAEGAAEGAAS
eukprot:1935161-Prymnesium_polylepis.1